MVTRWDVAMPTTVHLRAIRKVQVMARSMLAILMVTIHKKPKEYQMNNAAVIGVGMLCAVFFAAMTIVAIVQ